MGTMLHEFGHAVYDKYLGDDLPFFLRETAHTLTTEAVAMLMGRFSRNAAWLERYAGLSPEEARGIEASARAEQQAQLLILARWRSSRGKHATDRRGDNWTDGPGLSALAHIGMLLGVCAFTALLVSDFMAA